MPYSAFVYKIRRLAGVTVIALGIGISAPGFAQRDASFLPPTIITSPTTAPTAAPEVPPTGSLVTPTSQTTIIPSTSIAEPVQTDVLENINPESIGLITPKEGGYAASLWQGASYAVLARFMEILPTSYTSSALNTIARRLLLTQASLPEQGKQEGASLSALRIERLLALGDTQNAWAMANQVTKVSPTLLPERLLIQLHEQMMLTPTAKTICSALPEFIKTHSDPQWQKMLVVCQLQAGDGKAAQLTLDLLRSSGITDDTFFALAERNILAGNKTLPRQLTPLSPLNLALLQLSQLDLPNEIYARPVAALVPTLLTTKAKDETQKLALAQRSATSSVIDCTELAAYYRSLTFTPDMLATPLTASLVTPALERPLLYQAALLDKDPSRKVTYARQILSISPPNMLTVLSPLLTEMLGGVVPGTDYYAASPDMVLIYTLGNKPDLATEWLKLARRGAIGMPAVAADLLKIWPLLAASEHAASKDFSAQLSAWMAYMLKSAGTDATSRGFRDRLSTILLLLDAVGHEIPTNLWEQLVDSPQFEKRQTAQPLLTYMWQKSVEAQQVGLALLYGLLLSNFETSSIKPTASDQIAPQTLFDMIRSMQKLGLTQEAQALAQEALLPLILAPRSMTSQ